MSDVHWRRSAWLGLVVVLPASGVMFGCTPASSSPTPSATHRTSSSPSASAEDTPGAEVKAIDEMFRGLRRKLPEPATLSEQNGPSFECNHHGWVTYTLLGATAAKVPIANDGDLATLAHWCRDSDVCVRQIALDAVVSKIGFDQNRLVLPHMHDPAHYLYHDILLSLKAHLDGKAVQHAPTIFAGLLLSVNDKDFPNLVHGSWVEDVDLKTVNFATSIEVDADQVRVTQKHTEADPKWPDHTWTTKIKAVAMNDRRQYVVSGAWDIESNAKGYRGTKNTPSQFVYSFWPVKKGVVWFKDGASPYWKKLRRP